MSFTLCPKCGGTGHEFDFPYEPTARSDKMAEYLREWYEKHRESWWERHRPSVGADSLMLGLISEVRRIQRAAEQQDQARAAEQSKPQRGQS